MTISTFTAPSDTISADTTPSGARPRRSVLYMPGSNPRALEKARTLAADALILDLEDAVAPDAKPEARALVMAAVAAGGFGHREVLVRVNGLDTPWGRDDLLAAGASGADGIVIPKVNNPTEVAAVEAVLAATPGAAPLWLMMETARGVLNADAIAGASPRVAGLIMGTSDLTRELHARHTVDRHPMLPALGLCLLAARAHGRVILDGVHLDLGDEAGLADACRQGMEMGFDGKTLIHPSQIATANTIFAPSETDLAQARRIIGAYADAQAAGRGVVVVDGRLVEALHVAEARRQLALAAAITAPLGGCPRG